LSQGSPYGIILLKPTHKRGGPIQPLALTPFWHRRVCEATALIAAIILALFAWANIAGISHVGSSFNVSMLAAGIALTSAAIAIVSYFFAPERLRTSSALVAYIFLLTAIGAVTVQTGQANSPFLALWMIGAMFSGIFGMVLLGVLSGGMVGYIAYLTATHQFTGDAAVGVMIAGFLPLLMSYVLWHGKSSTEKTKERAYYDLANELNQVANKSEVVINAISDGVIAINNTGQIELINPAAERLVGWAHQDAMGLDYKSVLQLLGKNGNELEKSTDPVFEVLSTNQPKRSNDLQLQTGSGKKIVIELVVSPIGRLGAGAIMVFRDITKEQAEERAQAEFISTASHEMRTPVASIEGYLGLALNPATATIDAKAHDYITKAHESAEHLGRLFTDLLDVTKADDGRLQNNPKVIDVVSFTADIVEGLQPKADEKHLRLFFKAAKDTKPNQRNVEPIFYVDLDADHLREILANLVENAIKYTPKGEVVIDIQGDDEHVVVSIQDSGIGIPTEDIPHLFQKFYRVDNSDTREIGGTGLGLYLCRRLAEAMGGRIWVESEYKKGSTFSIELPRISHEEAQRLIEASAAEAAKSDQPAQFVGQDRTKGTEDEEVGPNTLTDAQRHEALTTPIIINKSSTPISTAAAPVAAAPTEVADPLVGATQPEAATPKEPLRAQNAMVLPASWQALPSNLQKAAAPAVATPTAPAAPPSASIPIALQTESSTLSTSIPATSATVQITANGPQKT
jgi:PAS domain S-box-containing protein